MAIRSTILSAVLVASSAAKLPAGGAAEAVCGDANGDTHTDIGDAVYILRWLFSGGPAPTCPRLACADFNADGSIDIGDPIGLLGWLFLGSTGPEPLCGGLECEAVCDDIRGFTFVDVNEQCHCEYEHDASGIRFVLLMGGIFTMGNDDECDRDPDEGPRHAVELGAFLIGKYEVTQRQWEAVMGDRPAYFQGGRLPPGVDSGSLPIEQVSWHDATEFCSRLGLRLPTESQWEYAARADTTTAFSFGPSITPELANYDGNTVYCEGQTGEFRRRTVAVDSFDPNPFGLHNVHGNVYEWCEDVHDPGFYETEAANGPDPVATSGSERRVARGGCFFNHARLCRSSERGPVPPDTRISHVGFRVVAPLPGD